MEFAVPVFNQIMPLLFFVPLTVNVFVGLLAYFRIKPIVLLACFPNALI